MLAGPSTRVREPEVYFAESRMSEFLGEPTLLVGDGAAGVDSPHARRLPAPRRVPSPACVAVLGRERLRLGDSVGAAELAPLYLRPSQAELRRRAATLR